MTSKLVGARVEAGGSRAPFIEPGRPWENGCHESFNGRLRDARLKAEIPRSLAQGKVLVEQRRVLDNTKRPHSALAFRPAAPAARRPQPVPLDQPSTMP